MIRLIQTCETCFHMSILFSESGELHACRKTVTALLFDLPPIDGYEVELDGFY